MDHPKERAEQNAKRVEKGAVHSLTSSVGTGKRKPEIGLPGILELQGVAQTEGRLANPARHARFASLIVPPFVLAGFEPSRGWQAAISIVIFASRPEFQGHKLLKSALDRIFFVAYGRLVNSDGCDPQAH